MLQGLGHRERLARLRRGFRKSSVSSRVKRVRHRIGQLGLVSFGFCVGASTMVALDRFQPARVISASAPYYSNCREAIQDGAAPIYYGSPSYRLPLDADRDGVACEPYRY